MTTVTKTLLYLQMVALSFTTAFAVLVIIRSPASQTVAEGATVSFVVNAASADGLLYQWWFRGEALSGATNAMLQIVKAGLEHLGSYRVVDRKEINDVAFLRSLIEQIAREYHPDPKRIHLSGHSNGAFMTFRFAMENADLVASVAPISGTMDQISSVPAPAHPVSVLQIHGTTDEAIPYRGGVLPSPFPSTVRVAGALEVTARWLKWNSCGELMTEAKPTLDSDRTLAGLDTIVSRSVCTNGIAVEHWAIIKGRHVPNWSTNFTKTMVQWLLAHPKP